MLERSLRSGSEDVALPAPAAGTTEFTDANLAAQTTYHYRLKALSDANESDWAVTSATTPVITGTEPAAAVPRGFPNPTRGVLTLENPGGTPAMLRLLDATGTVRLEFTQSGLVTSEVRLPMLPSGVYLLRLTQGDQTITQRLVVAP